MKKAILLCAVITLSCPAYTMAGTFTTFDYPGAQSYTYLSGIWESKFVGVAYLAPDHEISFLYDGIEYTNLRMPDSYRTIAYDISGNNIVGTYTHDIYENYSSGFLYNGSWTALNYPGATSTIASGIDGSNVVGSYSDSSGWHGFLYNEGNWTTLTMPGSIGGTFPIGISDENIVGNSGNGLYGYGFIFNISTQSWTTVVAPDAQELRTIARDIDGTNIIFKQLDDTCYNLLYNMTTQTWTVLNLPGGADAMGISGNTIVGGYGNHGFVYEIPEPASAVLIGLGCLFVRLRQRKC